MDSRQQPSVAESETQDSEALSDLGYQQELPRVLKLWTNWALGFAFISPVVGLYTVVALGAATAGPAWVWTIPIVVFFQAFVAVGYTQLAERWPLAGGIYQWSRRLIGPKYGWWAGWLYMWALIITLSTVAYGGGMFLGFLLGIHDASTFQRVVLALVVMAAFTIVNAIGLNLLKWVLRIGIAAEIVATFGISIALIAVFREQPISVLWETDLRPAGVEFMPAFIAALAVACWVLLGFDSCGSIAEETQEPKRDVPKAIVMSLVSVGIADMLGAVALVLASPDLRAVVSGEIDDPVSYAVESALGPWAATPFLVVVVVSFVACGIAVQATGVRVVFSFARDGMLPLSKVWRRVSKRNHSPVYATLLVAVLSSLAFMYASALPLLVAFATAGYYVGFLAPTIALLYIRLRGQWNYESRWSVGRFDVVINAVAVLWLTIAIVNMAWPRNPDLPWWENWGVVAGMGLFVALGAIFFFTARPDRKFTLDSEAAAPRSAARR